jgi:hypothetical protein
MVVFMMMFVMVAPASADAARANASGTWVLTGVTDKLRAPVVGNGNWTGQFDGVSDKCPDGLFSGTYEGSVKVGR